MKSALVIALDVPGREAALGLAAKLAGLPVWMKIGLELFTAEGPEVVRAVRGLGFPVFLDMKFHDIPNTVAGAVRSAVALGAGLITVHASGGEDMIRAAVAARDEAASRLAVPDAAPRILGVTVLTSAAGLSPEETRAKVLDAAVNGKAWGLDGVVCSGLEAAAVKEACGPEFLCLTPGIRMPGGAKDDQARVVSPADAVKAGADFLVMGRPVTRAANPAAAAAEVLAMMTAAAPNPAGGSLSGLRPKPRRGG